MLRTRVLAPVVLAGIAVAAAASTVSATNQCILVPEITNVRFGSHAGFDRMVIDIKGPFPENIQASKPFSLHFDPSGNSVPLDGKANVLVVLFQADAHTSYKGPTFIKDLNMKFLHGFVKLGDFENTVSFGVTTDVTDPNVKVSKFTSPNRVVVDIWK